MFTGLARSARTRLRPRATHGLGSPPVGVACAQADLAAVDTKTRPRRAKREPVPLARGMAGNAARGAVGARGAALEHGADETQCRTIDRVLVTEVPMRLTRNEAAALTPTVARGRASRVPRGFAHGHLLSVPVDVGLARRAGRAWRSLDLPFVARKNGFAPVAPGLRDGFGTADRVDASVRREAACLLALDAPRAEQAAVDERALARIVVGADD